MDRDPTLADELEVFVLRILNEPPSDRWFSCAVTRNAHPSIREGYLVICYKGGTTTTILPCRIPDPNCLAHEKMLHYMGHAKLPTKPAKPADWYRMAEEFARKTKAEYLA